MPKAWTQRLWLVLIIILGSVYILIPSFFGPEPSEDRTTAAVGTATDAPTLVAPDSTSGSMTAALPPDGSQGTDGDWTRFFPKRRLRLGLDLVGGSNLGLSVDTEETLRALANGHRREIRNRLEGEGIPYVAVNQPLGTAELHIVLEDAADRDAVRTLMSERIDQRLEEQRFTGTTAIYGFTAAWRQSMEDDAVEQVLGLLRSRVNTFGVAEPNIFRERGNRITVELPGLKNPAEAIENIKRTARLEFHIVDEEWYQQRGAAQGRAMLQAWVDEALQQLGPDADDAAINLALQGKIPEDSAVYFRRGSVDPRTRIRPRTEPMLLKREVALSGERLIDAYPSTDRFGKWEVTIKFDQEGGEQFANLTEINRGKRMAVVLESTIETDPQIRERIDGGSAVITLGSQRNPQAQAREASNIARVLKTGALPAPVRVVSNRTVGPTLGQDAIDKSLRASAVSALLVFAFALVWYRRSGLIAITCLIANGTVLLAVMTFFDATLTLPGIAGIVLTIAMALDANVLIYERIREELRNGKAVRAAVDAGFDKAFSSILDGNLTTAAAGIVLYWQGTDQIKGFAVTLLIGIATTLFTALVITRLLYDFWIHKYKPTELSI